MSIITPSSGGGIVVTGAASSAQLYTKQLLETMDPANVGGNAAPTTLVPNVVKMFVPQNVTISTVTVYSTTATTALVAGSNRVGIYTISGTTATLASQSLDIAAWPATTEVATALQASVTIPGGTGQFCYLAFLVSGTVGTFARGGGGINLTFANLGLAQADGWRTGTLAAVGGGNPLPNSFTYTTDITRSASIFYIAGK